VLGSFISPHSGGKERTTSIRLGAPRISETSSSSGKTGRVGQPPLSHPTYPTQEEGFEEALFVAGEVG